MNNEEQGGQPGIKVSWQYFIARAKEPTTWRGLILLATALGVTFSPTQQEAIVAAGLALAGLVGVFAPDPGKGPK